MPVLGDRVLDLGLTVLDTEATHFYLNSSEPATFTAASSTNKLGTKDFGAGGCFGSPAAGSPNGRKVTSNTFTDGTVDSSGTATHVSSTDTTNSRLLLTASLSSSQAVTSGNTWGISTGFDARIPNQ